MGYPIVACLSLIVFSSFIPVKELQSPQKKLTSDDVQTPKDVPAQSRPVSLEFPPQMGLLDPDSQPARRYISERNGRLYVDFYIDVPLEFLSEEGRLTLLPQILSSGASIDLPGIMLKGQGFYDRQEKDYTAYANYLSTIVDKSMYDSAFLDRSGVTRDLQNQRNEYYGQYRAEMNQQMGYEKWRIEKRNKAIKEATKQAGARKMLYHEYARKANEQAMRYLVQGKDTTGVWAKNMAEFEKKAKKYSADPFEIIEKTKTVTAEEVPDQYRTIHTSERSVSDIKNQIMTDKDSIEISKKRYNVNKITENEARKLRKDEKFAELVPYPFELKENMLVDSIIPTYEDFRYHYQKYISAKPGMSEIQLTMRGKANNYDKGETNLNKTNTLSFYVSSLSELADASMATKQWVVNRNETKTISADIRFAQGSSTFDSSTGNNRSEFNKIIGEFRAIRNNPEFIVDSIVLISKCSMEGPFEENESISLKRSEALKYHLSLQASDMGNLLKAQSLGEDWDGFEKAVQSNDKILNKSQIISLIYNVGDPDNCEDRIRSDYPEDYKVIVSQVYPQLRKFEVVYYMHRNQSGDVTKVEQRPGYAEGIQLMKEWKYKEAFEKLKPYADYNTALALAGSDNNLAAYKMLNNLEDRTGNSEYLLAIVSSRLKKDDEAINHLLNACRMNPELTSRLTMDTETGYLVSRYNLQRQIKAYVQDAPKK